MTMQRFAPIYPARYGELTDIQKKYALLDDLITLAENNEKGFQTAAQGVNDESLQAKFETFAQKHHNIAVELTNMTAELPQLPDTSPNLENLVHRGWMNIKSAVTGGDPVAILKEVARGSEEAMNGFKSAPLEDFTESERTTIQNNRDTIENIHHQIHQLLKDYKQ